MLSPTVAKAEIVSKSKSINCTSSINVNTKTTVLTNNKEITKIPIALFTNEKEILLLNTSISLLFWIKEIVVTINKNIVVVFIPPAVLAGDPPINIKKTVKIVEDSVNPV